MFKVSSRWSWIIAVCVSGNLYISSLRLNSSLFSIFEIKWVLMVTKKLSLWKVHIIWKWLLIKKKKLENVNYLNDAYLQVTRSQFADNELIALHQSQPFCSDQFKPLTFLPWTQGFWIFLSGLTGAVVFLFFVFFLVLGRKTELGCFFAFVKEWLTQNGFK